MGRQDARISISTPDGGMTPPVDLSVMKEALAQVKGARPGKRLKADPEMDAAADRAYGVAADELRGFVERVERLEAERAELADDVKAVMAEAKSRGYDTKALRRVIRLRKADPRAQAEFDAVVEVYKAALGMG